jgi:putative ubiquitin-RnfH superfamily antitoxin RatB of RatAB toxin-antitoxin module
MLIHIEVACALPDKQVVKALDVAAGCTALEAVALSGIGEVFPALALDDCQLGIFSRIIREPAQHVLADGDRVEIYRPLLLDPKEARRQRAKKTRSH